MTGTVLSAGQAAAVLFGTFVALLIARVPVAFALGLACLAFGFLRRRFIIPQLPLVKILKMVPNMLKCKWFALGSGHLLVPLGGNALLQNHQ
jgi:hypothetical protein